MTARFAAPVGPFVALAVAAILVPLRGGDGTADVALLLAVVVVGAALAGGRLAGAWTAVVAALAFDFFHTHPYQSLKVTRPVDVIAMGLLLVLGLVAGSVAGHRRRADRGSLGIQGLHRLSSRATIGVASEDLVAQVATELREVLPLAACWYEPAPLLGELPTIRPDGSFSTGTYRWSHGGFELPREGAAIALRVADRLAGRFVLAPRAGEPVAVERRQVAVALVEQLGLVLALRAA